MAVTLIEKVMKSIQKNKKRTMAVTTHMRSGYARRSMSKSIEQHTEESSLRAKEFRRTGEQRRTVSEQRKNRTATEEQRRAVREKSGGTAIAEQKRAV